MGAILGGIFGVMLLSLLFGFIIEKIRKEDTLAQRIIATIIAFFVATAVWTSGGGSLAEGIIAYGIGSIAVSLLYLRKFRKGY